MKGTIKLVPVDSPVEGLNVVTNVNHIQHNQVCNIYKRSESNPDIWFFTIPSLGYSSQCKASELRQIVVEYDGSTVLSGPGYMKILPLHPDQWSWALGMIGHEVDFEEKLVPKDLPVEDYIPNDLPILDKYAKIITATPVRTLEDIPEELRKNYTKEILSEMMIEDEKLGLYDQTWNNIFSDYQKEEYPVFGGPFTSASSLEDWLKKNYHPPKRRS